MDANGLNRLEAGLLEKRPKGEPRFVDADERELAAVMYWLAQRANEIGWTFKELAEL